MDKRVFKVIVQLNEQSSYELRLEQLARSVNLSTSRLRHLFKAETGVTLAQYQQTLKMQEAKNLLENTFLRVKEITNILRISSESYFVRTFKKHYGHSPLQHRIIHLNHKNPCDTEGSQIRQ